MKAIRAAAVLVWLAGFAWPAFAQTHAYSVHVDLDDNPATGCTIVTPAGPVNGIEAVLTAEVSVDPVVVTGQHIARCQSGVLDAPVAVAGSYPYPVGFDQGVDGFDVIELGAPLQAFGATMNQIHWRLTFASEGALLGGADLTDSVLVPGLGFAPQDPTFIPATSLFALALLALALAIGTAWMVRRRPQMFSILLLASALGLSGLAWAAVYVLDGSIGDWSGAPRITDPPGDATQDEPPIDIRQAFAAQQGGYVFFRIDVSETRLAVLLPPLLDTSFSITENSPNGTVLGPVRPASSGLSSILDLALTSQTPAAGFAFDPATTVLTVGNTALLDFETHPQFQLGFSATLAGLPGYTLPLTVVIAIDDVNEAPTLAAQSFTVLEHAADGTPVGTVAASDPDAGANGDLSYAITGGSGATVFAIDIASGDLSVADTSALDVATSPYFLDVTVSDAGSPALSTSATMTVSVVDVNDPPSFTPGGDVTVDEDSGAYDAPWASNVFDGDDGTQLLEFEIANDNPALFLAGPTLSIVGNVGQLGFTPATDANGVANLTVVLRDDGGTDNNGVNESAPVSFQIAVTAINDAPQLTVPGAQSSDGSSPLVFSTANGNAISVSDVDAGEGTVEMSFSSDGGDLTLANPDAALDITGNGGTSITATGTLAAFNAALNGASGALTYTPTPGNTVARTLTITIDDQGHTGAGGALNDSASIGIDAAPTIAATPAAGLIATDAVFTLSFSEPVDVAAGAVTLTCNGGTNLVSGGDTGSGVTTLTPSYTGPLPEGETCVLAVAASGVSDSDAVDPPDQPIADFSRSYSVDAAPTVTATNPANGTVVGNDVTLSVTFNELVDATPGAVTLTCNGGANLITGWDSGNGVTTLTPSYTAPLPAGNCTLTIVAANIDDSDLADPPANLVADHVVNFTVDAAPAFVSAIPAEGDAIATTDSVSFTFDEAVNDLGGAIELDCSGPVAGSISGSGTVTLTFTPDAPLGEGANCTATAMAASIGDSDAADPPEHPAANVVRSFTVDTAPSVVSIAPADGTLDVGLDTNIVVTFSEPVNFTASAFALACPDGTSIPFTVTGDGTDTATIDPTPVMLPINTECVFSVDATQITDVDAADPPDAGSGIVTASFTTVDDEPPSVVSSTPTANDTTANNVVLAIAFSEAVNVAANAVTLTCGGGNLITGGDSGIGVTSLAPTYAGTLPNDTTCTLTVLAGNVTDVDVIDPPDEMLTDYIIEFTVDAPPSVASTLPTHGASNLTTNTIPSVTFSEAVTVDVSSFAFACDSTPVTFTVTGSGTDTATLTPTDPLPAGVSCTVTVLAAGVEDVDTFDPPGQMEANHAWTFTTDAPPTVESTVPAGGAVVNTSPSITVNFSESVNLDPGVFALDCGGPIATTPSQTLPANGIASIDFTPDTALSEGTNCTATVLAGAVHDADSDDPPDTMAANHVWTFSVDAAPFISSIPGQLPGGNDPTSTLAIGFSEPVNFDTTAGAANTSFDLECPAGSPAGFTVATASPASSVVLDPVDNDVAGASCTLTVRAAGITDVDDIDPPDTMASDFSINYFFAALANDDAYTVTPHLTLTIGAAAPQGGGVLANDIIGAGTITGFGFAPACTGTTPGNLLDAGPTNGRLTLNLDGSFSYEPPAAIVNTTRTFCYTVSGNDTANIVFTVQNTELVWFVDAAAPPGGTGTQARPFQTLAAAAGVDTANDTIFLAFNASPYTGGITLEAGERLIGAASGSDLATITGIAPVAGSAFPALAGSAPTITCGSGNCITLNNSGAANTHVLRGFIVGNTGTGGTKIAGTTFGTLTVAELTLDGGGRALSLVTGTLNGSFVDIDVSGGTGQGIGLDTVGGTWSVINQASIVNVDGTALNIINTPTGGSASFAGGLVITKPSSGPGINFNANAAPINLGAVTITTSIGAGLVINNSTGTTTIASGSVNATGGPALNVSASALALTLTGATSTNSPTQGINLNTISGTVTINGGAISGSTGTAFNVDAGASAITYGGTISNASGRSVVVQNRTGTATVAFTGSITDTGTGVLLNGNAANSVTSFRGGLVLNTGTNAAFTATSGGTLEVCDENPCNPAATGALVNTLTTSTSTALNVSNTSIGANDLEFRSISANGAPSGIILNNTGASGSLRVKGNGGPCTSAGTCTGGAIQSTTGDGVVLTSTRAPSLTRLFIGGSGGHGINATTISNGLTLANSHVANSGNADEEFGLNIVNLSGTATISDTTFNNAADDLVRFVNNNTNGNLTVTGSSFVYPATISPTANAALALRPNGTSNLAATVQGNTFTNIRGDSIQWGAATAGSNGTSTLDFSNNTITVSLAGRASGFSLSGQESTTGHVTISGNGFSGAGGNGVVSIDVNDSSLLTGTVSDNIIDNPPGIGLFVAVDEDAEARLIIDANTITGSGSDGIQLVNFGGVGVSDLYKTVTNNQVNGHSLNTAVSFVGGISVTSFEDATCIDLTGNNVTGTPANPTQCGGVPCVDHYLEEVDGVMRFEEIPNTPGTTLDDAYVNLKNDAGPVTIFGIIDLTNGTQCPSP